MSHEKICKKCGYANPYGSKFCNNCGEKLPLSTHIICPNCGASNSRDRVFCDECGSRLIPDTTKPEKPPAEEPAKDSGAFTLPARKPGETGELDPQTLPDWLRTGDTGGTDEIPADEIPIEDLPPVEELKPEEDKSADLPDWLVHESKPIIHAPTVISTELYQDLLENAEDLPQPDDLVESAGEANLPDWLLEPEEETPTPAEPVEDTAVTPPQPSEKSPSPAEPAAPTPPADREIDVPDWLTETDPGGANLEEGLTNWLFDLEAETQNEEETESTDLSQGLTEWLADSGDLTGEDSRTGLTDLFVESAEELETPLPAAEEPLAELDFSGQSQESLDEAEISSGLTDWLTELEDEATAETTEKSGLTDWLNEEIEPILDTAVAPTEEPEPGDTEDIIEPDLSWLDEPEPIAPEIIEPAETPPPPALESEHLAEESAPEEALPLPEEPEPIEPVEEITDDEFARLFAEGPEEALPEWLSETDIASEPLLSETPDLDILAEDELPDAADLDWTADLIDTGMLPAAADAPDQESDDTQQEQPEEEVDWLSDLAAISTGQLIIDAQDSKPELSEASSEEPAEADEKELEAEEAAPLPDLGPIEEADSWATGLLAEEAGEVEDLPEWLNQLDEVEEAADIPSEPPPIATDEELPEWITSMRPSEAAIYDSRLPDAISTDSTLGEDFEDIPADLAGAELPDWLDDVALAGTAAAGAAAGEETEIPDWLVVDDEAGSLAEELGGTSSDDWQTMLDELPDAPPMAERLAKADIPEWVQALKPAAVSGEAAFEPAGPEESVGPLSGLHGVVPASGLFLQPHEVPTAVAQFTTSPEQEKQMALLRQLAREEPMQATKVMQKDSQSLSIWLRVLLAFLLIAAVILGLRGVNLINKSTTAVPEPISGVHTAVQEAAGHPVLVAIEYTPAMAGELDPLTTTLLNQLEENQSQILIVSQHTTGTPLAANFSNFYDALNLGYLPGNAVSLRQLNECMAPGAACQTMAGQPLSPEVSAFLENTALVIVITGNRESLLNWVEQVGRRQDMPMVAGVTQGLVPLTDPYFASGQLSGILSGMPGTAVYQLNYTDNIAKPVNQEMNALLYAQILVVIFLIVGLIIYGTAGFTTKNKANKT